MQPTSRSRSSISEWKKFLHQCIAQRINSVEFKDLAQLMWRRHPIPGKKLVDIVIESRELTGIEWDPLIPKYVDHIQKIARVKVSEVLSSLLAHSSILSDCLPENQPGDFSEIDKQVGSLPTKPKIKTLISDYGIIQNIVTAVTTNGYTSTSVSGVINACSVISKWIMALVEWNTQIQVQKDQPDGDLLNYPDFVGIFVSIGFLFGAIMGTDAAMEAFTLRKSETFQTQRTKLAKALTAYSQLCAGISAPLRNRIDQLQKEFDLFIKDEGKSDQEPSIEGINVSTLEFESNVVDTPALSSRAGLYIYINALGHHVVLVEELITASFDILSNGMYRNEPNHTMFLLRAFLVNKLPPFLADMSASVVEPVPMEICISQALARVDPNTFPSFSQMFASHGNSVLSDVRQEFLFSCALHKLIPESSIERLLGENPMQTLPVGGSYVKHELVTQINSSPERAEQLLSGIESMEGNARAIVEAISEVMRNLCIRKDTMTLRSICNSLSRRPQVLDVMLLFKSPTSILQPLCALLDAWKWDEEHGESQPVYDEFGSILLLILAFKYKYNLLYDDLGISDQNSFVLRLLDKGASCQKLEELTEKQMKNLGGWINSLFIAEGISDESMSSCSPQEFYLLTSTLFSQSLGACEAGKLEFETLKGGFEYLLEPFLLPSLVMALNWLGKYIWTSENDLATSLRTLHVLLKPTSISGEAQEIHQTVICITAKGLEDQLKEVKRRHPTRTDIKPILDILETYHSFQRTGAPTRGELEGWRTNSAGGGMITSIRNTFSSLVLWSTSPEISMTPPSYTHRQILAALKHLGAVRVLSGIIDELKLQSETGSDALAVDIAATLICAPQADCRPTEQALYRTMDETSKEPLSHSRMLTLRDALNLQRESLASIIETDPHRAELIIRVHRRVEILSSLPQIPQTLDNIAVDSIMEGIDLDGVTGGDPLQLDPTGQTDQQGIVMGTGTTPGMLDAMLDAAASEAVGGSSADNVITLTSAEPDLDASIFDDMLNGDGMGMGNPDFIDLEMEGMF
ncbi:mediator complex subunit [Myotisia sp. PD_48]|nr:mediator complex subunit [Myotisia sp. PD_48]